MPEPGKVPVLGVGISVVDYDTATDAILAAARDRRPLAVTALATHGVMETVHDEDLQQLVNSSIDIVTPDGQPVRWAMNLLHGCGLPERVYGPDLVACVCQAAAAGGLSVYLFGSTADTCQRMAQQLVRANPGLRIAGVRPDRFREPTPEEDRADVAEIRASGADIVLVGRGCPRQERWVATHRDQLDAPVLAVGAAFDYFAGNLRRPPAWAQRAGLEWCFRLAQEPRRLFRRYLVFNTQFSSLLMLELLRRRRARDLVC